ncbi:DUF4190 domain-containing protein [Parafrigoribacterium humi]|uniref:DUF4190 domain-containing protein n=1 Tax=Parafrigoribacterium humi TaxID=3144664 RepID=UPI0032EBC0C5
MSDQIPTPPPAAPYSAPGAPVGVKTNTLSIVALILGFLVPIGGIITGHIALGQIKRTGEAGHGMALAGTILGYVLSVGWIVFWIVYIVVIVSIASIGASIPNY